MPFTIPIVGSDVGTGLAGGLAGSRGVASLVVGWGTGRGLIGLSKMDGKSVGVETDTVTSETGGDAVVVMARTGMMVVGVAGCPPQLVARRQVTNKSGSIVSNRDEIICLRSRQRKETE
jgi:hypothetical protein